ncbi:Retrovirus-related Pol polyprotein from type-1 retrotransposable element R1 [Araneus ventricosus]|uniref:Retrovirus-related Pol polyprotein from type-1 retrotransposable element R1 n=1 Tax=Araneus ventricosus TaxID=182803 RepID=A0A4Y2Q413_ARAVE|nr:Retrovirus-related Pol polyprotein from type-1 retrotransposable element R1 [Araneus ventricosus]
MHVQPHSRGVYATFKSSQKPDQSTYVWSLRANSKPVLGDEAIHQVHRTWDPTVKAIKKAEFRICRAKFRRMLSIKRDKSWSEFCREVSSLNEYALPYKICANKVRRPLVIGSIQVGGRSCTSLRQSIEQIVRVLFPSDDEVLTESREKQARRLFVESYDSTNRDPHFTKTEVWSALKQSKRRKAPGLDRLQYEVIVAINNKSPRLLVSLFNRCLDIGHFPRPWKCAKVVLLNKPGKDTSDPRAYRPICLLSTMSKVLDKLVSQRILYHYHSNNLLNPLQHASTRVQDRQILRDCGIRAEGSGIGKSEAKPGCLYDLIGRSRGFRQRKLDVHPIPIG